MMEMVSISLQILKKGVQIPSPAFLNKINDGFDSIFQGQQNIIDLSLISLVSLGESV